MNQVTRTVRQAAGLAVLALAGLVAVTAAGVAGSPTPPAPQPTADGRPDPVCASYGKDFTRVAGTSTCVKISGYVQTDGYRQSLPTGDPLAPALTSK